MGTTSDRSTLHDLPMAMRLVIAAFLVAVLMGYIAAIAQLKMQLASAGEIAPGAKNVIGAYSGEKDLGQLVRLLEAADTQPLNGQGSMRSAYTKRRSGGWSGAVEKKGKELGLDPEDPKNEAKLDEAVARDRDGERQALIAWLQAGADRKAYDNDQFFLPEKLKDLVITEKYDKTNAEGRRFFTLRDNIEIRCVRCHKENAGGGASQYPLGKYEQLAPYFKPLSSGGMSLPKLAQTTHVHLLGFSMLWGLTGLIFAATRYPGWIRAIFGPWVIIAQIVDISCWWLARLPDVGPMFAQTIMVTGGLVALGLFVQVVGSLFDLFGGKGKLFILLLLVAGMVGLAGLYLNVVSPYLKAEVAGAVNR